MPRTKEMFLIAVILLVALPYTLDFFQEIQEKDHDFMDLVIEGGAMLTALLGIGLLIKEIHQRQSETEQLHSQLNLTRTDLINTRHDLSALNTQIAEKVAKASRQYGEVIQEQLTAWDFTPSEKEVALLLLKGLSFDEIASVRDTKEKTVRQQATAIYRKSGLTGRHEFAAWFFEDFLQ
jgi:DNA-binding NarL/FixJ family response regulator